jgi:predicted DNA binding protein
MLKLYPGEVFKEIQLEDKLSLHYAISNYARIISYADSMDNGRLLKGGVLKGYKQFRYAIRANNVRIKTKHFFVHKLVANYFVPKNSEDQDVIIHLDHNRSNDFAGNLKWVTKAEATAHHKKSPAVIEARKKLIEHNIKSDGHKLTETQVIYLKKKLLSPNRKTRLKIIAKQFGVSEMTLHRIRTGENWGHIKV